MSGDEVDDSLLRSERIRRSLANEIAVGGLAPGTSLDEQSIADRFGVSRTPVREAFRMLAADGLVENRPRRGVVVASLSLARIADMFETAAEIEALCVRLATFRMTSIERNRLREIHEQSEAMVTANDVNGYDELNLQFHETIYQATHNSYLAEQAVALRTRMMAFRRAQLFEQDRPALSRGEHDDILWAIMRGDGDEAARRMRSHMFNASVAIERYVAGQSASESPHSAHGMPLR